MEILDYAKLSQEVFDEINVARQMPDVFASSLIPRYQYFEGTIYKAPNCLPVDTDEGEEALTEAIDFLKAQSSLPVLVGHEGLQRAAMEYAEDIIHSGDMTYPHVGDPNTTPSQRISKYLHWGIMAGECIDVGNNTAADIVASLVIDDSVDDRSNRKVLFHKDARLAGVVCLPHSVYGVLTVIDIVGGIYEL
eukprot:TRINITY_DN468_c0_g1_i10.p1 TRINITY_DN468_c0_g1~~TRINITY_DN468_c0_g1_i10.p1  ORF type:complete len:192 (+),score=42.35 TRINITY_DN468_c0_g1_i10:148-723(+)